MGADPKEIIFTSGATEANNLAIKGVANFYKEKKNHIITLQTDHKCVLDSCRYLQNKGFKVTYLPVKKDGLVDLELLEKSFTPETVLVSVMMVNNEIGLVSPLYEHLTSIDSAMRGACMVRSAGVAPPHDIVACSDAVLSLAALMAQYQLFPSAAL